jgi:hypothetical protein
VPAIPLEVELAGTEFDKVILADTVEKFTVLTEAFPEGSRRTKILSVLATLEAVGSSDTFLLLSAIIYTN